MVESRIWIIKSIQTNPNALYVKVDGSEFYIAIWVACAKNKEEALSTTSAAISELELGETEVIVVYSYDQSDKQENRVITERVADTIKILNGQEDVQLAVWSTSNGGIW